MALGPVAQDASFLEITREPLLAMACSLLLLVSVAWIVVARLIIHNYRKTAVKLMAVSGKVDVVRPPRDIWTLPPEPRQSEAVNPQKS